jgi:HlyD family secretion protein
MKTTLVTLLALALALGLASGCRPDSNRADGSGTIECTQVQVAPQVAGRLNRLPPQEGDTLKKGDLVAELDRTDYELKRAEAKAALAHAQAQLDLLLAGSREEDIRQAEEQVRGAQAAAKVAASDLERVQQVFATGSATAKQRDDARAQADRTAAALAAAEQNLAKLKKGSRQEEIEVARAVVVLAQARLARSAKDLADCTVMAPMGGVVTTRSREEGEWVNVGTPLLTLSRLDEVWLSVYVPENRLGRVKLGQRARVRIDGEEKFFEGVITFVSSEAEFTPRNVQTPEERTKLVYRVKITLPNPNGIFKPGLPADGYLETVP